MMSEWQDTSSAVIKTIEDREEDMVDSMQQGPCKYNAIVNRDEKVLAKGKNMWKTLATSQTTRYFTKQNC